MAAKRVVLMVGEKGAKMDKMTAVLMDVTKVAEKVAERAV